MWTATYGTCRGPGLGLGSLLPVLSLFSFNRSFYFFLTPVTDALSCNPGEGLGVEGAGLLQACTVKWLPRRLTVTLSSVVRTSEIYSLRGAAPHTAQPATGAGLHAGPPARARPVSRALHP